MWIALTLLSAFFLATSDALLKFSLQRGNEIVLTFLRFVFALPVLYLTVPFIQWPVVDSRFWVAVLGGTPLEILAIVLYVRAMRESDLSLCLPMLSLTPVFLIFVSWILIGERVSLKGGLGVALVTTGAYVMNISATKMGLLYPFRVLLRDRGVQMMICVSAIYSITSTIGKIGIMHSSVLFFPVVYFTVVTLGFLPLLRGQLSGQRINLKGLKWTVLSGVLFGFMIVSHMFAISMAKVAYMIALKRTSILFGALYGFLLFREKGFLERLSGILIMIVGIFLITSART